MRAALKPLTATARGVPRWWWALFSALVAIDVALVAMDFALDRRFPSGLQAWMLLQALLAILAVFALAFSLRDLGYGIFGGLFVVLVVEDWLQLLSPTRLRLRTAIHDLLPWLGEAPDRLSKADPVDLVIVLAGSGFVIWALRATQPRNRAHIIWLTGFLAVGFIFGGLFDLYNDYNYSRFRVFIEETGEAAAISGTLAYLAGVTAATLGGQASDGR